MIISRGRRYIFVHVPKTGGTSVATALEARAMRDDILIGDTPKAKRRRNRLKDTQSSGRLWKHSRLRDIYGLVTQDEMEQFFVFTLVRNPWDRMVSYYHWLRDQKFQHPAVKLAQELGFSAFLNHPETEAAFRAAPYVSYVADGQGQERADLYARIEHLEQDLAPLWDHLGFRLEVPHINRSRRARDWRGLYTESDAQRILDLSGGDAERFGYRFDRADSGE